MKFTSRNTVYNIENEILTIAFADSKCADPDKYLILQREIDSREAYYYEVNGQGFSNEGGINIAKINNNKLLLIFDADQRIFKEGIPELLINFDEDINLNSYLIKIFENTDTSLILT